jgi:hypothetical protein
MLLKGAFPMSLNVGAGGSKFVYVSNPTMCYNFSDKVIFVTLKIGRKTGKNGDTADEQP